MSSQQSTTVDGKEVKFRLSNEHLEWEFVQASDASEKGKVRRDAIIAVIPDAQGHEDSSSTLLTIEETAQQDEAGEATREPRLKALKTSGLPDELKTMSWVETLPSYLRAAAGSDGSSNIHVIISWVSGSRGAKKLYTDVLEPLLTYLSVGEVQVHETQTAETITEFTRSVVLPRAREGVSQTLILLSGDGGLVDIIKTLYAADPESGDITPPVVALIPMGTGNATANSTGLMKDSTLGLSTLVCGTPEDVPVFRARVLTLSDGSEKVLDMYGAVVASWGMHASLVADSDTPEYRRFGPERFKMAAKELLYPADGSESHRYKGKITLIKRDKGSGEEYREVLEGTEHMYVLTTMVSELEKGFMISPRSRPLDGQLRFVHFGPVSPEEAMRLLGLAYQGGKHVDEAGVGYEDVEGARIDFDEEADRWRRVCVDGTVVPVAPGGWMEVRRAEQELIKLVTAPRL